MGFPRFGPAGIPERFLGPLPEFPAFLRSEGLDAFEYQGTRWGPKPQIRPEEAIALGRRASEKDVLLTIHASYFINLCGEDPIVMASKGRLLAAIEAATWMGAKAVVFHPGYYGKRSPREALKLCLRSLSEVSEEMEARGIRALSLRPETAGKTFQLGSLEEILALSQSLELVRPTIDWGHVYARARGSLRTKEDYGRILGIVEKALGSEALRDLHCHFTKVEFGRKGERSHRPIEDFRYGPEFEPLAMVICDMGLKPVFICESPLLDLDAQRMRRTYEYVKSKNKFQT
ncbi:TIM barrel protein [Candidatus Bathyarchaeota archaeon]|nr:TIM barrel protein [Candidatus Bathyarchaeota archaeon]